MQTHHHYSSIGSISANQFVVSSSYVTILKNQINLIRYPLLQHVLAVQDDSLRSNRKAVVGKVVRDARMILDIHCHHLLVVFNEGRIIQRVTNKHILEHPEQPLCPLSFAIKWTIDLSSINYCCCGFTPQR